jgi:hypothetical protein
MHLQPADAGDLARCLEALLDGPVGPVAGLHEPIARRPHVPHAHGYLQLSHCTTPLWEDTQVQNIFPGFSAMSTSFSVATPLARPSSMDIIASSCSMEIT